MSQSNTTVPKSEVTRVKGLGFLWDKRTPDRFNGRVITRNGKITAEECRVVAEAAKRFGSGVAAHPVTDTIKVAGKGMTVDSTPDRSTLWAVQTPQAFAADKLIPAYLKLAADKKHDYPDDAALFEAAGGTTRLVKWDEPNLKITTPIDLTIAAAILRLN